MYFLHNLHRPKWAASQVSLTLSTFGLSTAQWSVTTAVNMHAMPTSNTKMAILILVRLCIFPGGGSPAQLLSLWQLRVKPEPLDNADTDLKPSDASPQWLQQVVSSLRSPPRTSVFSPTVADLWAYGSKGRGPDSFVLLSCPSFPHTMSCCSTDGATSLESAVELDQRSWWPECLPWWVTGVFPGVLYAINVAGESTRQAPCLSGYSASVMRLQTSNFKCTNSFLATIEFHIVDIKVKVAVSAEWRFCSPVTDALLHHNTVSVWIYLCKLFIRRKWTCL